ncbi:MAG: HYR domain-containing protein [Saprospiraceae bacterium]|nr:HYR domain-containing protein [Saprospiraceae bacterium]
MEIEAIGGTAPYLYLWNTGEASSQRSDLLAGDYTATATDGNGCTHTIFISLQPSYPIAALNADGNVTCARPSVALDGSASSQGGDFVFSWSASNGGRFTSSLDSLEVTTDAAGTYTLEVTDTLNGCSDTATVDVAEDTVAPFADAGADFDLPCTNSIGTLSGSGSIGANFTYEWQAENGGIIFFGADTPFPIIAHVGSFILTVSNLDNGCSASDTVSVTGLNAPPSFTVGGGTLTCNLLQIQLATDLDTSGIVFGWTRDSSFSATDLYPTVTEPGAYVLTATDTTTTCSDQRTALVLENTTPPTAAAIGGTITCTNSTATITSNTTGDDFVYEWSGPNGFSATEASAQVEAPGEYAIVVTDTLNGCATLDTAIVNEDIVAPIADAGAGGTINCSNPTLVLNGSGSSQGAEYTYLWTTADGQIAEGETTLTPTVDAPGTYILTVTNTLNGCTDDDGDVVVDADFTAPTGIMVLGGTITCFEPTLRLQSAYDPTNVMFYWSSDNGFYSTELWPVVDAGGDYILTITDTLNGCSATTTAAVIAFLDAPDLALTGGTITCSSPAVNIQAVTQATDVVFYWAGPNNFSSSEQNPTVTLPGLYEVVGQDTVYGCISLDSVLVEIDTVPPTADAGNGFVLNCNIAEGQLDGAASSEGDYSYLWTTLVGNIAGGETTLAPTVDAPGTYTLSVTSQTNGCVAADDVVVTQATPLNVQILDLQNVSCHGTATGSASVVGVGGTGDYSYVWSSGGLSGTASGLVAGNYSVVVTDGDGCRTSFILSIGQPDILLANVSATGQSLPGVDDGIANANPTGGTGPYNYAWSNGLATQGIANLAPGAYTLTVTDDKGCTTVETANVNEFPCTLTGSLTTSQATCFGAADGSALVILTAATLPITYDWSNGDTLAMADSLAAGIYSVSVSDSTNCSLEFTLEITQPTEISVFELFHEDAPCPTDATGSVTVAVNGGVQPYQYLWSNGSTEATASGLSVGEHTFTLTDANGCGRVLATTILGTDTEAPSLVVQDITASLGANGTVGISPEQFDAGSFDNCGIVTWSVTPDAFDCSQLGEQVVTITATDANGNTNSALATVTINDDRVPVLTCPGNVTLSNCDPELTFLLPFVEDNCAVDISQVLLTAGLPSGSDFPLGETVQTFSYVDAAGNAGECSFTVTVAPSLAVSATSNNVSCAGVCDGSIELSLNAGVAPYQVLWSNGATEASINGLCAGSYEASISDASGCQLTVTLDISAPAPLGISLLDATSPVCQGDLTGSISVAVTGGTTPYHFDWSNANGASPIESLGTGTYSLLLTDANGCTAEFEQTLAATDNDAPVLALQNVTVSLGENGTAMVSAAMFDNGSTDNCGIVSWIVSSNSFDCGSLGSQSVTLTATDANGNTATGTATVTVVDNTAPTLACPGNISVGFCAPAVQFTLPLASDNCAINLSSLLQTAGLPSGATFPTGMTTQAFSYTDAAGNVGTCSFTVTVNSAATITSSVENVSCNDECDGSVTLTVSGGFVPFSYLWSNGQTTPAADGLCAGSVSGTVTDAGGCQQIISATITEPAALGFNVNTVSPDVNGTGLGSIGITVSGGTTPYSYAWTKNGQAFSNAEDLGNLNTGNYIVVVTDANGCTIASQNVFVDNLTGTDEPVWATNLRLFPNPAVDWVTLELGAALAQDANLAVLDHLGRQIMFAELKKGEANRLLDLRGLPAGTYFLRIRAESEVIVRSLLVSK